MRGMAKSKAVTSGRLTGRVKMQPARRRLMPNPGTAPCPEPAFSLCSTDAEDQVASLHTGLDRCAALLSGILQAEKAEAVKSPPRAVRSTSAKARPSDSLGKRTMKKAPPPTEQKSCRSVRSGPGRATHRPTAPAAHSGVKLHPPREQAENPPQTPKRTSSTSSASSPRPPPGPSPHPGPPASDAPNSRSKSGCDGDEEDVVPVRDTDARSAAAHTLTAVRHSHAQPPAFTMPKARPGSGQLGGVPEDTHSSAETDGRLETGQYLLGQLKALITGQGSVAERLLSDLEQTVLLPLMNAGSSNIQTEPGLSPDHSQNTQLSRRVKTLNQQSKEKTGRQQNHETPCHSGVLPLQEELAAAQLRLQELQDDLAELRRALQDTQSRLRDSEEKNALVESDLDAARSRLLDSERERRELASTAQQRLEEIGRLRRALQSRIGLPCTAAADSSVPHAHPDRQHRRDPAELPTDRITQYLMSLGQPEATRTEHLRMAAEREGHAPELRDASSHPDVRRQPGDHQDTRLLQSHRAHPVQPRERPDNCDVESVWSEWSMRSGSTFDTRDEAAFQDGLSALDASIASLQKTIQLDLGR